MSNAETQRGRAATKMTESWPDRIIKAIVGTGTSFPRILSTMILSICLSPHRTFIAAREDFPARRGTAKYAEYAENAFLPGLLSAYSVYSAVIRCLFRLRLRRAVCSAVGSLILLAALKMRRLVDRGWRWGFAKGQLAPSQSRRRL